MARRSGKIQDWATASKAHHNPKIQIPGSSPGTWGQGMEDTHLADLALLRATWRRDQCPPGWDCYHARTAPGLVCSALDCGMMHGANIKPRNRPTLASAKPSWRCQAGRESQKVRSACVTRIRAARKSSGPRPAGAGYLFTNSGFPYQPMPTCDSNGVTDRRFVHII